jgi:hypothetical protein
MTRIRQRATNNSPLHEDRLQIFNPRVIWDGSVDCFDVFRNNVDDNSGQSGAAYLFDPDIKVAYLKRGTDCYVDFLDEVSSAS